MSDVTARDQRGASSLNMPEVLWMSMLFRALPALIGSLVITFTQDHNARFGFVVFGAVLLWSGIIVGFEAIGIKGHPARPLVFTRSIVTALTGGFAIFMGAGAHEFATVQSFILTVAIWGIVTGAVELAAAAITRRKHSMYAQEIAISGALTLLLGVVVALVPPNLHDEFGGRDQVQGALTADVQAVGFVGAYFAVLGVLLIIEALSLRAAVRRQHAPAAEKEVRA